MKKYFKLTLIFVVGFVAGALAMDYLSIPARKVYREHLQRTYLTKQQFMASSALKEGKELEALVPLWSYLNADPLDGSRLFGHNDTTAFEDSFGFFLLPWIDKYTKTLVHLKPGGEDGTRGFAHGQLAAVLQSLGYDNEAKIHWSEATRLLKMPEGEVRKTFTDLLKKAEEGKRQNPTS
jgi:hypothetical protein